MHERLHTTIGDWYVDLFGHLAGVDSGICMLEMATGTDFHSMD